MAEFIDSFVGHCWFLSNFCVVGNGVYGYPTNEHFYQAMKTTIPALRDVFRNPGLTAGDAKKLGRKLDLREDWEDIKDIVMLTGLRAKFAPGSQYSYLLIATGNKQLIEGNTWHDNYWGDCHCGGPKCQGATNKLGYFLMQVREELQQ